MFVVGDTVRGNARASERYGITKCDVVLVVTAVHDEEGTFTGRVVSHPELEGAEGETFTHLTCYRFDLVRSGSLVVASSGLPKLVY